MGSSRRTLRLLRGLAPLLALLSAAPASAYVLRKDSAGEPVRWEGPVRFVADAQLDAQLQSAGALASVQSALQTYGAAGVGLQLELTPGTPRPVGFDFEAREANENAIVAPAQWDYEPSAIAVTVLTVDARSHRILDADIALNTQHRRFRVLPPEGAGPQSAWDDVQNTVTHELGHAMGLAHNPDAPGAVMFPTAARGETSKRALSADDQAGLEALYGAAAALHEEAAPPGGCSALPSSGPGGLAALLLVLVLAGRRLRRVPLRVEARRRGRPPASWLGLPLALLAWLAAPSARASAPEREPPPMEEAALVLTGRVVRVQTLVPARGERILRSEVEVEVERCIRGTCPRRLVVVRPGGRWGDVEQFVEGQELPASGEPLGVVVDRAEPTPHQPSARTTRLYALGRVRDLQAFARGLARLEQAPAPAQRDAAPAQQTAPR